MKRKLKKEKFENISGQNIALDPDPCSNKNAGSGSRSENENTDPKPWNFQSFKSCIV